MANLIIKPASDGNLILQDEGGDAAVTVSTTGNTTLAGTTNNLGTVTAATINGGSIGDAVTGNGLAFKKIGSGTFSNSGGVDLAQDLGRYRIHKVFFTAQSSQTGGSGNIFMRFKVSGSWVTGTDYAYTSQLMRSNSTTPSYYVEENASYIKVTGDGTRGDKKGGWEITIHNATKSDVTHAYIHGTTTQHDGARRLVTMVNSGLLDSTGVVQDIRIYPPTYNLTGSWELYGLV